MSTTPSTQPFGPPIDWSAYYLSREACAKLGIQKDRLHELRQRGRLVAWQMPNGDYLFDKASVDALDAERAAQKQAKRRESVPEANGELKYGARFGPRECRRGA